MVTPDRLRTHQVAESHSLSMMSPIQAEETQNLSRVRQDPHSIQNTTLSYPRIPRLVPKSAKSATPTLDSQFQVNASHVQKPFSLIVPVNILFHYTFSSLGSRHVRMKVQERAAQCQLAHNAVRRFGMKSKCPDCPTSRPSFLIPAVPETIRSEFVIQF
jgi:hypothetical protein